MPRLTISPTLIIAIICLLVVVPLASGAAKNAIEMHSLRARATGLQVEIEALQARNGELKRTMEYLKTDTYIEQAARQELGYIKPTETAIIVVSAQAPKVQMTTAVTTRPLEQSNPQRWVDFFFTTR